MKKRLLSTLLTLCIVLALLPVTALAMETSGTCGENVTWSVSNGVLSIQGTGPMTHFPWYGAIPWIDYSEQIHTVKIGDGVTSIGNTTFNGCFNLANVTIPNSVTAIGSDAFYACYTLTSVTIPEGVTKIGHGTFAYCTGLTSLTLPSTLTTILDAAFTHCDNLTEVYYGGSESQWKQISIGDLNTDLTSATIHYNSTGPSTTPAKTEWPTSGSCGDNVTWSYNNGILTISGTGPMDNYEWLVPWLGYVDKIRSVTVGEGVTTIGSNAFFICENLTSVTIPNSVVTIGDGAFYSCTSLSSLTIPGSVTTIEMGAFVDCDSLTDVYYGGSEDQWKQIAIDSLNESLTEAAIHYTNATSSTPTTNAVLSPQKLAVDGKSVECEKYNIGGSNYFKLRDLAYVLNGTGSQFGVGFDAATSTVTITTGAAYTPAGGELAAGVDNSATAQPSGQVILIDGVKHDELTVYNIGGSNFFQLRELGNILGFEVGYDQDTNTAIVRSVQK